MIRYRRPLRRVDEAFILTLSGAKNLFENILKSAPLFQYNFARNKDFVRFLCENLNIHLSMDDEYNLIPAKQYITQLINEHDEYIFNIMIAISNTKAQKYKDLISNGLKGFLLVDDYSSKNKKPSVVLDTSDHLDYICYTLIDICKRENLVNMIIKESIKTYNIKKWFNSVP